MERNREVGSGRGGCFAIPGLPPLGSPRRSWLSSLSRGCFPWPAAFQEGAEDWRRCKAFLAARRAAGGSLPLVRAALFPARPRGGDRRAEAAEPSHFAAEREGSGSKGFLCAGKESGGHHAWQRYRPSCGQNLLRPGAAPSLQDPGNRASLRRLVCRSSCSLRLRGCRVNNFPHSSRLV